jgi:hypothetical protein
MEVPATTPVPEPTQEQIAAADEMIRQIEEQQLSGLDVEDPLDVLAKKEYRREMTPNLADQMLELMIASRLHLNKVIEIANVPHLSVIKYIMDNDGYRRRVAQVHTINAELLHQEALDEIRIADNKIMLERAKLMLNTAQWLLERFDPETYSPRLKVEETHKIDLSSIISESRSRVASIQTQYKKLTENKE